MWLITCVKIHGWCDWYSDWFFNYLLILFNSFPSAHWKYSLPHLLTTDLWPSVRPSPPNGSGTLPPLFLLHSSTFHSSYPASIFSRDCVTEVQNIFKWSFCPYRIKQFRYLERTRKKWFYFYTKAKAFCQL